MEGRTGIWSFVKNTLLRSPPKRKEKKGTQKGRSWEKAVNALNADGGGGTADFSFLKGGEKGR